MLRKTELMEPADVYREVILGMTMDDAEPEVLQEFHKFWCVKVQQEPDPETVLEDFQRQEEA